DPVTRKTLLDSLAEKGFGDDQLAEAKKMINAEDSDVFDVLAYIAFTLPPISREERVETHREIICATYEGKQQAFLEFVLGEYVRIGVDELDINKLAGLLELKYGNVSDAAEQLGSIPQIRDTFIGFQRHLYARDKAVKNISS
ncbi:MAG: type I restriction-modification enzyme R subunit C-terminal domain-containing protein, partial [Desulfuromonadaceae bacterium]